MRKIIITILLLFIGNSYAQFESNRFYLGLSGGIAKGVNASNEKTVPSFRVFLQHRILGNWLFGQLGGGYTKLQATNVYWAKTAYADERLLIVPYSTDYFLPFLGAGIGLTKAVYSTGTSYLAYSPLFAGIQTKVGDNIVFTSYGGFALSFSDSLDGRPRDNNNLNPITNSNQDGFWFWEAGLQFGFPGRKKADQAELPDELLVETEQQAQVTEPSVELQPQAADTTEQDLPFAFETQSEPQVDSISIANTVAVDADTFNAPRRDNLYRTIGFSFGGADLSSEAVYVLRVVADSLKNNPSVKLRIVGHADNQGSKEGIERFATARAVAVRDWLVENGVDETRLVLESAGARQPRGDNNTHEGRASNRRVEIWVMQ